MLQTIRCFVDSVASTYCEENPQRTAENILPYGHLNKVGLILHDWLRYATQ